ncbi:fungal-specific transcription factor domain-containing protein [Cladorrhinum sp. PSN332]|nr:fungal-specific transcription factor domain-containing protein [Cladorrhinum sp. PSN332]
MLSYLPSQALADILAFDIVTAVKACDLCHIKKIRCDAKKPVCSHCEVYKAQCVYTPHIKRRRKEIKIQASSGSDNHVPAHTAEVVTTQGTSSGLGIGLTGPDGASGPDLLPLPLPSGVVANNSSSGSTPPPPTPNLGLPPLQELYPRLQDFFFNYNSILPLFDQAVILHQISTRPTDPLVTAAVYAILALAYQHRATAQPPLNPPFDQSTCLVNAQSLLSSVTDTASQSHDEDLLTLQTTLSLIILHQGTRHSHLTPQTISNLLGAAVKLVHKLSLHQSRATSLFPLSTALQRTRAFWVTYILDRDISLRGHVPYLLQDHDHDISLPSPSPTIILTKSGFGSSSIDIFLCKIRLAQIQGRIYQSLYSVRAQSLPEEAKHKKMDELHYMLSQWFVTTIPDELRPERVNKGGNPGGGQGLRQLVAMYFTYLNCVQHMYKVGTHEGEWVARLVRYSQKIVEGIPTGGTGMGSGMGGMGGGGNVGLLTPTPSLSPEPATPATENWEVVVTVARECAGLFGLVDIDDYAMIWNISCIYMSAALTLVANALTVSEHGVDAHEETDTQIINSSLAMLERSVAEDPSWTALATMLDASSELSCRAKIARARFALSRPGRGVESPALAWLEAEARRSAGHSAITLVQAFSMAADKPLVTRMWAAGVGAAV